MRKFKLESGVSTTTEATRKFFANNYEFTVKVLRTLNAVMFVATSGGDALVTSPLKKVSMTRDGKYVRFETRNSVINVYSETPGSAPKALAVPVEFVD